MFDEVDGYHPFCTPPFTSFSVSGVGFGTTWLLQIAVRGSPRGSPWQWRPLRGGRSKTCSWAKSCTAMHHPSPYIAIHRHTRLFRRWAEFLGTVLVMQSLFWNSWLYQLVRLNIVWCFDWTSHGVKLRVYQAIMYFQRALQQRVGTVALPRWATQPVGIYSHFVFGWLSKRPACFWTSILELHIIYTSNIHYLYIYIYIISIY